MKTYLMVFFNSEGARPTEITDRLLSLGFKPTTGNYDYVYEWGNKKDVKEVIWFGDKIHSALKGFNVLFKMETV